LTKDLFVHWIGNPFALEDHQEILPKVQFQPYMDVASDNSVNEAVQQTLDRAGRIDVAINAGIAALTRAPVNAPASLDFLITELDANVHLSYSQSHPGSNCQGS
jgi:NAD(P)-dependent dehydrogenase (short-subunit alcohol dehydrogenase family)